MMKGKPAKNRISSSFLFLMELILALLLFSIASAACISVFVKAHAMSEEATALSHAADEASSVVEVIRSSRSADEVREKILTVYPDAKFVATIVKMSIRIPVEDSDDLIVADVLDVQSVLEGTVEYYDSPNTSGEPVVEIPFSHYLF